MHISHFFLILCKYAAIGRDKSFFAFLVARLINFDNNLDFQTITKPEESNFNVNDSKIPF